MCIRFKDRNDGTPTKEELKLHIIETLIEKRYNRYNNTDLGNAMANGTFKKIYNEIIKRVFD